MYIQYLFVDMCFLFLSCVGLSHPKNMFSGFLLYVVFQHHFIGKMYQIKQCFIGDCNIDRFYIYIYIKKTKCPQKRVPKQVIHINNL